MPKCVYKDCKSTSKGKKSKTHRYHPFPKPTTNLIKCLLWLEICGNEKLNVTNITKNTYVSEKHFDNEKNGENPIPFYETAGEDPRKFKSLDVGRMLELGTASSNSDDEYMEIVSSLQNQEDGGNPNFTDHTYYNATSNSTELAEHREIPSHSREVPSCSRNLVDKTDMNQGTAENLFSFGKLSKSIHFEYFTGISLQHFEALYTFLDPSVMPTLKYKIGSNSPIKISKKRFSDKDKLCLTLVRIKRGYTLKELSIFCNSSISHMSVIFHTWVQFMYLQCCVLRNSLFQGARNMQRNEMPACFRAFDENVTAVLDCTEIKMHMSQNFQRQGNTFSSYKHYNSVKFL